MSWPWLHPGRSPAGLMTALLLAWGVFSLGWGERLPRADGFGWDGQAYRSITEQLWQPNPKIWPYTGHRCLPSVAVHYTLRVLHLPLDGPSILKAFAAYNLVLLVLSLWMLLAAAAALGTGPAGQWVLFLGVFCNYVHLKQHYYSACVTDVWAFACAVAAVWCYLRRRSWGVLLAAAVGAFTWPMLLHFGAVLYLLPRPALAEKELASFEGRAGTGWAGTVLAAAAALAVAGYTSWMLWKEHYYGIWPRELIRPALPLGVACAAAFVFAALRPLLGAGALAGGHAYRAPALVGRLAALALVVGLVEAAYAWLDTLFIRPGPGPFSGGALAFLRCTLITGAAKPFGFLVAHVIWYGPIVLAAAFCWGAVCRQVQGLGPGLVLAMAFGILMALNPESRQSQTFFPIYALLTAVVLDRHGWGPGRWLVFAGLALALSKAWLPLNRQPWPAEDQIDQYPMQLFFMSFGGYMTRTSYAIQGGVVLLAGGLMAWLLAESSRQ